MSDSFCSFTIILNGSESKWDLRRKLEVKSEIETKKGEEKKTGKSLKICVM